MNGEKYVNNICDKLSILTVSVWSKSSSNLQDLNVHCEIFYRDFLHILYGWELEKTKNDNEKGIDLIDWKRKIVVQVSSDNRHKKIQDSLDQAKNLIQGQFHEAALKDWEFVFLDISHKEHGKYEPFEAHGMKFQIEDDIINLRRLIKEVKNCKRGEKTAIEIQRELSEFVDNYFVDTFGIELPQEDEFLICFRKAADYDKNRINDEKSIKELLAATNELLSEMDQLFQKGELHRKLARLCANHRDLEYCRLVSGEDQKPLLYTEMLVQRELCYLKLWEKNRKGRFPSASIRDDRDELQEAVMIAESIENTAKSSPYFDEKDIQKIHKVRLRAEKAKAALEEILKEEKAPERPAEKQDFKPSHGRKPSHSADSSLKNLPTLFSQAFDSELGKDLNNQREMEVNAFRYIASGKIIVLQGPQIMDNRCMLQMLQNKGFRRLCEKGFIVFSPYSFNNLIIDTPADYLIDALEKDENSANPFKFSSTEMYKKWGSGFRMKMKEMIANKRPLKDAQAFFPSEDRDELTILYDGYRYAAEAFRPEISAQFHQKLIRDERSLGGRKAQEPGLFPLLEEYISELTENEKLFPIPERAKFISGTNQIICGLKEKHHNIGQWMRRDFKRAIEAREIAVEGIPGLWPLFEKAVNRCYTIANGSRSSNAVFLLPEEDILRIYGRETPEQPKARFDVDFSLNRYLYSGTNKNLATFQWEDFYYIAEEARKLEWEKIAEKTAKGQESRGSRTQTPLQMHNVYSGETEHQEAMIAECNCKTMDGKQYEVTIKKKRQKEESKIVEEAVINEQYLR